MLYQDAGYQKFLYKNAAGFKQADRQSGNQAGSKSDSKAVGSAMGREIIPLGPTASIQMNGLDFHFRAQMILQQGEGGRVFK